MTMKIVLKSIDTHSYEMTLKKSIFFIWWSYDDFTLTIITDKKAYLDIVNII